MVKQDTQQDRKPCPNCNFEGATASQIGWVYDPTNPDANEEGLVKCSVCNGEGFVDDDQLSLF